MNYLGRQLCLTFLYHPTLPPRDDGYRPRAGYPTGENGRPFDNRHAETMRAKIEQGYKVIGICGKTPRCGRIPSPG